MDVRPTRLQQRFTSRAARSTRRSPGWFGWAWSPRATDWRRDTPARAFGDGILRTEQDRTGEPEQTITWGGLVIDPGRQQVTWRGAPLRLTRLERDVLGCLAEPPLRVWSYERLYAAVWRSAYLGDTSTLHAATKRLRRKLREAGVAAAVESVRGVGFRLSVEPTPARVATVTPVA